MACAETRWQQLFSTVHTLHAGDPSASANVLMGQVLQTSMLVAPTVVLALPMEHDWQVRAPVVSPYCPAGHGLQAVCKSCSANAGWSLVHASGS